MSDPYRWSAAARELRERAAACARSLDHGCVLAAHVLLALAETPGAAAELLEAAGAGAATLREAVAASYDRAPLLEGVPLDTWSDEMRELVAAATEIADLEGSHEVEPLHLLLAVTEDPQASAVAALRACGLDVARLRERVRARLVDRRG
ncbi:MAG: hypothetical protein D6776_08840 [Planctomycetota bacterium]|nr:MAG: hypothetical protein D6776_08840 [Planctomycetota bacterium]